jgi:ADP-heptose:LPS heptosyltransferase
MPETRPGGFLVSATLFRPSNLLRKTLPEIRSGKGILVLDHHGFGNVVMSIPLLRVVCEWEEARLPVFLLLKNRQHFELISLEGLPVETLYLEDFKSACAFWPLRFRRELALLIDLVIAVPQIPVSRLLFIKYLLGASQAAGEIFKIYRPLVSFYAQKGYTKPILKSQEELAWALGIETPLADPSITISEAEARWSFWELKKRRHIWCRPLIGVHCSTSKLSKSWPAENFGQVIAELRKIYPSIGVLSFGADYDRSEAEKARRVADETPWFEGTGEWSIRESLAMLAQCDLVLSGDTGIMHMAAAVGSKTLTIFGATSSKRLAPRYNDGRAITPEKDCYPCYRDRFTDGCQCINEIVPQKVVDKACTILSKKESSKGSGVLNRW